MAKADGVFIYIGTYPNEAAARADYDLVKDLHALGAVGTYDAAVIQKDDAGQGPCQQGRDGHPPWRVGWCRSRCRGRHSVPSVDHRHRPRRRGHRRRERSSVAGHVPIRRQGVRRSCSTPTRRPCLIIGESTIEDAVNKAQLKAEKHVAKELNGQFQGRRQGRSGSGRRSQLGEC